MLCAVVVLLSGCHSARPAGRDDPATATLAHWAGQPGGVRVVAGQYRQLWDAADEARQRYRFEAGMTDYRGGLLTTLPMVSAQFFEPWRDELKSAGDVAESSLATVRRRVRFEFARTGDGRFTVEPKVIVERLALSERRITSAIDWRSTLGPGQELRITPADAGRALPRRYWYAIGRDEDLERVLAARIARRSGGEVVPPG